MGYKNKTYVCFDADTDMKHYGLMKAWKENEHHDFDFHNAHEINNIKDGSTEEAIKKKLRERLLNTKVLIVLIGANTKNLYKYVRWEIEYAIEKDIPIIAVNLNGEKKVDSKLCPPLLKDKLAIHTHFGQKIINHALNKWPDLHTTHSKKEDTKCAYHFKDSVYDNLK